MTDINLDNLRQWLTANVGPVDGELAARRIGGGASNFTYLVSDGTQDWVVRRSPAGAFLPTAHDMVRDDGTALASGSETRVWGRFAAGPGSTLKGEAIPDALKALFQRR